MAMTSKEVKELAAVYEHEDQFWALVRRRFVVSGLVAILIGAGAGWGAIELVVRNAVETPLKDLQKQIVQAEVQADLAKRASETARTSAEQAAESLRVLNAVLQGMSDRAKAIDLRFEHVPEQINAAWENANLRSQRDYNAVQQRIAGLEALVKRISEESAASRKANADYAKQVAALEAKVEKEQKRFSENAAYTVSIFFDPSRKALANELQGRLTALGFRAPTQEAPAKMLKGNALTYSAESEAKAQEVLAHAKPVVKDLQGRRADPKPLHTIPFKNPKSEFLTESGVPILYDLVMRWNPDPKSMQLQLGGTETK